MSSGPRPPRFAVLLWDLDGTLVDSRVDLAAAGNVARAALGLPAVSVDTVTGFVGDGVAKLLERLCPDVGPVGRRTAQAAFCAYYADHCTDATRPYPGMDEVLAKCQAAGCRQAVVSNKPVAFCRSLLAALGLAESIQAVIGGDTHRKPDPEPLRSALATLGATAAEAVMIGDHHTDLLAAVAAGIPGIWCRWGLGNRAGAPALAEVAGPEELLQVLEIGRC